MDILLYLIILIIPAIAQILVSSSFAKYRNIKNDKKLTGFDVAKRILEENDLKDVYVVEVGGRLTDHYDPKRKVVRLSSEVFHNTSVASLAVAAHECGHALQDKEGYLYMRIRSLIFPVVHFATSLSYFIIFLGIILESLNLVWLGIILVSFGLIFQIVTLPVEINASIRASKEIERLGLGNQKDKVGIKRMLTAAASTYLAGVLSSALELLRLILIFGNRDD